MRHDQCRGLLDLPTEILVHIFTIIRFERPWRRGYVNRATMAALARTCRAFKEPALDVLWEDIEELRPLLLCLPEGLIRREGKRKLVS
jgi:hypothetical protein